MENFELIKNYQFAREKEIKQIKYLFPLHRNGWPAVELNVLLLTIIQTFTTFY